MPDKDSGKIPKALRIALALTQERFAARLGVTVSTVNRWENGKGTPSPLAQQRIKELWRDVESAKKPVGKKAMTNRGLRLRCGR